MRSRVFLSRLSRDLPNYLPVIRKGLEFVQFGQDLPRRPRVFIKPNLTFPYYQPGVMTSPEAIEAAIIAVSDYTDAIWIGDSDSGGYNPFPMEEVYASTGIAQFAAKHGVKLVNLSKLERTNIPISVGGRTIPLEMPRLLTEEIDVLVTMPVPKVHMNTGVSLTFKNQWGCIPEPNDRLRLHPYFKTAVLEINQAVKARFGVIDGRYGLNRSGPLRGNATRLDWVCVSDSLGAGARVVCELIQIPVKSVPHLRFAESRGFIPRLKDIDTNTEPDAFVGPKFYLKRSWTDWPVNFAFRNPTLGGLAYFYRWSAPLHRLLSLFREPFYDYKRAKPGDSGDGGNGRPH